MSISTVITNPKKDMSKLTLAAEELIKVAHSHVESTSLDISKKAVQELKNVTKSIVDLTESVDTVGSTMIQTMKMQSICWAIANVQMNHFSFSSFPINGTQFSDQFVKKVLLTFRCDIGHYIPNAYYIGNSSSSSEMTNPTDKEKKAFRDALEEQLFELLGQDPKIKLLNGDDRYIIFYS